MSRLDLNALQLEVHQLAVDKGWYEDRNLSDPYLRDIFEALLHSEVSEAVECIRDGDLGTYYLTVDKKPTPKSTYRAQLIGSSELRLSKPCGLPSELADVVIRALDTRHAFSAPPLTRLVVGWGRNRTPMEAVAYCNTLHARIHSDRTYQRVIEGCYQLAADLLIDIEAAILEKHAFNKTRPHRHGGKAC